MEVADPLEAQGLVVIGPQVRENRAVVGEGLVHLALNHVEVVGKVRGTEGEVVRGKVRGTVVEVVVGKVRGTESR